MLGISIKKRYAYGETRTQLISCLIQSSVCVVQFNAMANSADVKVNTRIIVPRSVFHQRLHVNKHHVELE
jgi:hypothetical protein